MGSEKLTFIEPGDIRFWIEPGTSHLRAEVADRFCILQALVKRAFPMSYPKAHLSVQTGDSKEVGILRGVEGLDEDSRRCVEAELDRRYFTPRIEAIESLQQEGGIWTFSVETQRGRTQFYVRNWRDSAHEIGANRWQIHSVDGQRFEIPDASKLDRRSQSLLEQVF